MVADTIVVDSADVHDQAVTSTTTPFRRKELSKYLVFTSHAKITTLTRIRSPSLAIR